MRRRPWQISEEGPILVLADELLGLLHNPVVAERLAFLGVSRIAGQRHFLAVADEIPWKVGVGMDLVVIAEEQVEAVLLRDARRAAGAVPPFAETAGRIAG